jgi:hypothetical protein
LPKYGDVFFGRRKSKINRRDKTESAEKRERRNPWFSLLLGCFLCSFLCG